VPLVVAGLLSTALSYKTKKIKSRQFYFRFLLWLLILIGLVFAKPIYDFLFSNNLTRTEPLSLFDVIQITGILYTLLIANRAFTKANTLQQQVQDLHQNLAIHLSDKKK
jgi:hypothetical protein